MTPDETVAAYFAALEGLGAIRARPLSTTIEVCGRLFARAPCGGPRTQRKGRVHRIADDWLGERSVAETVEICARCGEPWAPADRELGLIRISTGRRDATEARVVALVDRLAPLRALVEPRPRAMLLTRWRWILAVWRIYLLAGSYAGAARIAQDSTRAKVEGAIAQGRAILTARMGRR